MLYFTVSELPTLAKVEYEGEDKLDKDDFKNKIDLTEGQVYSKSAVDAARQKILDIYSDKGYLLAKVDVEESDEKEDRPQNRHLQNRRRQKSGRALHHL